MKGFIYKTTNVINGKEYIGMCSSKQRFESYLGSGILLRQAIEKYGKDNFVREILEECDDEESLRKAEIKWIRHYDAVKNENFYNLHEGGRGGSTGFKEETSMATIVKKTWSEYSEKERKARGKIISKSRKEKGTAAGKNNTMYGRSAVKEKNLKWYTNGEKNVYVTEGTEPVGYKRGRTTKWQGKNAKV